MGLLSALAQASVSDEASSSSVWRGARSLVRQKSRSSRSRVGRDSCCAPVAAKSPHERRRSRLACGRAGPLLSSSRADCPSTSTTSARCHTRPNGARAAATRRRLARWPRDAGAARHQRLPQEPPAGRASWRAPPTGPKTRRRRASPLAGRSKVAGARVTQCASSAAESRLSRRRAQSQWARRRQTQSRLASRDAPARSRQDERRGSEQQRLARELEGGRACCARPSPSPSPQPSAGQRASGEPASRRPRKSADQHVCLTRRPRVRQRRPLKS